MDLFIEEVELGAKLVDIVKIKDDEECILWIINHFTIHKSVDQE